MSHEMKPGFLSLPRELQLNILSFLSCRDILCCTSVCKVLCQMYMSSSELQYIVELSGQWLLHVPNSDNESIPVSKHLQLLRDKAHAWFKVDPNSFKTVSLPKNMYSDEKFVADGHIYLWDKEEDMAAIVPILPKPSQKTVKRNWSPGTLFSVPDSRNLDIFVDPAQNLIAIAYSDNIFDLNYETLCISLRVLDRDGVHPQAAGWTLFSSILLASKDEHFVAESAKLKGFGRHIALRRSFVYPFEEMWQLHIWDWQHSTTSNSILSDTNYLPNSIDFCFLGNNRLLVVTDELKLYSIKDMSQTPQLLACFIMPGLYLNIQCFLLMDHIDSSPQLQAQQAMYTSDPINQLLCITTAANRTFVISTRMFFNLEGIAAAMPVPWERWGPSNTRVFGLSGESKVHISGNRVLQALSVGTSASGDVEYTLLHILDFSPLAVTNRRGLGRVVKEPSTVSVVDECIGWPPWSLTTSLPYVEVILDRKFGSAESELADVWVNKDRIYLLSTKFDHKVVGSAYYAIEYDELEVIDV
ncbi:uncharacterized protein HD556DRAFT_1403191 [Suillus plorans]|uniref:F-box domain-containing protein n=1 Tax=Suillus plorans TaxID=116603 RepID=A0A9P7AGY9_9AGAM|nr:uncharacterized protein HD556DRAFT_1403191 [Suillus plorans]KAG1788593.1 hypothetical protein HD556DRAFT_1403191 [Suillus plorans]